MARCVGILFLMCLLPAVVALAQSGSATSVVRTPWGAPDLRGVWDYRTMTPLQRSADFAAREFLSDEEAATYERQVLERRGSRPLTPGSTHAQWWLDQGTALTDDHRTSLIVDPPDGRIPPLTPEAQAWNAAPGGQRPVRARQIDDPTTFTRPFTAVVPMRTSDGSIYEYAYHEGNYAMVNGLTSARNHERARATSGLAGR